MRVFSCLLLLILTANAAADHADTPRRVITVSVLNDVSAPVPPERIRALLDEVFAEYDRELNIKFQLIESLPYDGDLKLFPLDQAFLLERLHARGEIRIIFSNRTGREGDSYLTDADATNRLAGSSHPYYGHAIIYNVEARDDKTDAAGHPALVTALKHEIAHLFGVEHSRDTRSFMYTPSSRSQGEWTTEVIEQINAQRSKHWFPRA
ncbi:MAG TPA: matrixin family metalloprotease [Blastocatellia bacterium]|nr:matrixin family metalloprotease [Blastocatellia bacterium]